MPLLLESLRAEDGRFESLAPHIERMERSGRALYGPGKVPNLQKALEGAAESIGSGLWKVRVLYDREIHLVEAAPYKPRFYRSAALVDGGSIRYPHKLAERPFLDELAHRALAHGADTALITVDGRLTDFSYANAAFFDGSDWWTPSEPLLAGTRRWRLLASGRLKMAHLRQGDLKNFSRVSPINAMLNLDEVSMDINRIVSLPGPENINA